MTGRTLIGAFIIAAVLAAPAHADVVFSNLGPGDGFGVTANFLFDRFIGQPTNQMANSFTTASDRSLDMVQLALSIPFNLPGGGLPATVEVCVTTDQGGQPGITLECIRQASDTPVSPALVTFVSVLRPRLLSGTRYWVIASASTPAANGTVVWWHLNSVGDTGLWGDRNIGIGNWFIDPVHERNAFRILGSTNAQPVLPRCLLDATAQCALELASVLIGAGAAVLSAGPGAGVAVLLLKVTQMAVTACEVLTTTDKGVYHLRLSVLAVELLDLLKEVFAEEFLSPWMARIKGIMSCIVELINEQLDTLPDQIRNALKTFKHNALVIFGGSPVDIEVLDDLGRAVYDEAAQSGFTIPGSWLYRLKGNATLAVVMRPSGRYHVRVRGQAGATPGFGTTGSTFDLTIAQPRADGSQVILAFDHVPTAPGAVAAMTVGEGVGQYALALDMNGDGTFEGQQAATSVGTSTADEDADGLPDIWEQQFSLDYRSSQGEHGGAGDPDGDGLTNAQEFQSGTHPRGFFTRYFAEGVTSPFFDTRFAVLNPDSTHSSVVCRFLKADGTVINRFLTVAGQSRETLWATDVPGLGDAEFSTVIESDVAIVADRTTVWDDRGYGSHAETSVATPSTRWYLAEGATHSGFQLFYLLQNPGSVATGVTITYLLPSGAPLMKTYSVPANSRFNVWVNSEATLPDYQALASMDVSARIVSDQPIIVERAMYLDSGSLLFGAGHESAGVTAPALNWFLAEGATGDYFDEFLLVANPNATDAEIAVQFLLSTGPAITRQYTVPANSRFNIWVDTVDPALSNAAVSTTVTVTNDVPVIVERAMWWPGPTSATWLEAHNSPGVTQTGTKWALAEGEQGGTRNTQTYILVANTSAGTAAAKVTLIFEDGTASELTFSIGATSRFNVDVGVLFPTAVGRRFGAVVESTNGAQIVVERAMYWNADGVVWAAGTNAVAARLQ